MLHPMQAACMFFMSTLHRDPILTNRKPATRCMTCKLLYVISTHAAGHICLSNEAPIMFSDTSHSDAWRRQAAQLAELGVPLCGVACASTLVTDRPKKGDHKVPSMAAQALCLLDMRAQAPVCPEAACWTLWGQSQGPSALLLSLNAPSCTPSVGRRQPTATSCCGCYTSLPGGGSLAC